MPNAEGTPASLRYAISDSLLPYLTDEDRRLISASAEIIPHRLEDADVLGNDYDFLLSANDSIGGKSAPAPLQVNLLIDPTLSPLDNATLADILRRVIIPKQVVSLAQALPTPSPTELPISPAAIRAELANAGYPDGFDLTLSSPFTAEANAVVEALAAYGIEVRIVSNQPAHLTITSLPTANAILLYDIPLTYLATDGLIITFTPSGFPIASR